MHRFKAGRLMLCIGLVLALMVVTLASLAVQAGATPEPTVIPMLATMAMESGACPQESAQAMLQAMATDEATPAATSEAETTSEPTLTPSGGVKCLYGYFSGPAEVSAPGAPDAVGFIFVTIHPNTGNLCYDVAVAHLTLPATGLNLYQGTAGHTGALVLSLPTKPAASGIAQGCVTNKNLTTALAKNPDGYFVNVATTDFKNGAARAQLEVYGGETVTSIPATAEATASS
jgi:hypothetical protein